jgi:hypothetical protein
VKNKLLQAALIAAGIVAVPAHSAVFVSSIPGSAPFGAPATFSFDAPTPEYDGPLFNDSAGGVRARPFGSTGGYAAVSDAVGYNGSVLDLTGFGSIASVSFLWGSIDSYNLVELLAGDSVIASFTGGDAGIAPASGDQTDPNSNRYVTFDLTDATRDALTGLRFSSAGNSFEFDNVSINSPVPEPAVWGMLFAGFALIGHAMRRRGQNSAVFA